VVTANAVGSCTITAKTYDDFYSDTCTIYVVNELHKLTITPTPSNATIKFNGTVAGTGTQSINVVPGAMVSYEVSRTGYETVTGTYTMGSADHTLDITLNPISNPVTNISLNRTSGTVEIMGTMQLNATISPSNASDKSVT
jgi:uncharacterized protein YjdB